VTYIGVLRIPIAGDVLQCFISPAKLSERIIDAVLRLRLQGASRRRAIVPSRANEVIAVVSRDEDARATWLMPLKSGLGINGHRDLNAGCPRRPH
jgi:hypothetical protein